MEEWTVPTKNWPYQFSEWIFIETIFDKNYVIIRICQEFESEPPDIYLILNLVTRKPYWIKQHVIEDKIFTMVNDSLDHDQEPYHLGQGMIGESEIIEMKVETDEITMKSFIQITHDGYHGDDDFLLIGKS